MSEKSGISNAMVAAASMAQSSSWITLNAAQRCDEAGQFEDELYGRIIAQDEAVLALSQLYQLYLAGLNLQTKPIGTLLFLGPTGSGKTRVVEAAAEVLFNDPHAIIKIDCAEFQHSHEISKLIGSPPGYLGHRETLPLLSQENLDRFQTQAKRLTFILFDEIEKASDALWQLLLGILDKATLRLGDNRRVDFSQCIIVMTSNLGARQMSMETEGKMGFEPIRPETSQINNRLQKIAIEAARRRFSPEFMNRLDKIVVFQSLSDKAVERILDLELDMLQRRVLDSGRGAFVIRSSDRAKKFLLMEGIDRRYGARPLKRAIERHLVIPISNMIATKQLMAGDILLVDFDEKKSELCFKKTLKATVEIGQLDIPLAPSNN
ncbi:MAG: AAA family ATPase [Acidobacteria bacterium]|nr:AAA family ATPase [Acidobacteriota bacterium]